MSHQNIFPYLFPQQVKAVEKVAQIRPAPVPKLCVRLLAESQDHIAQSIQIDLRVRGPGPLHEKKKKKQKSINQRASRSWKTRISFTLLYMPNAKVIKSSMVHSE